MNKKWLSILPLLLGMGIVWPPTGFADRCMAEFSDSPAYRKGIEVLVLPQGILLADSHRTEEQTGKTTTSDHGAAEKKTATDNKNKAKKEDSKTKPLKSFEPTEKVKADQAVDFPYDI